MYKKYYIETYTGPQKLLAYSIHTYMKASVIIIQPNEANLTLY